MDGMIGRLGLDWSSLKLAYMLGREQGRKFLRGALVFPGIRVADLEKVAAATGDDVLELVSKRDRMIDATVDFLEELVDLDSD